MTAKTAAVTHDTLGVRQTKSDPEPVLVLNGEDLAGDAKVTMAAGVLARFVSDLLGAGAQSRGVMATVRRVSKRDEKGRAAEVIDTREVVDPDVLRALDHPAPGKTTQGVDG